MPISTAEFDNPNWWEPANGQANDGSNLKVNIRSLDNEASAKTLQIINDASSKNLNIDEPFQFLSPNIDRELEQYPDF